jgi:hypothetical protein
MRWFGSTCVDDFPDDLYESANYRVQKFVRKWAIVLTRNAGCRGTNNVKTIVEYWNGDHPEDKISVKSFYRNKARLKNGGWEAFFGLPPRKRQPENKTEPPLSQEELKQVRALLSKMNPPTQATA